MFVWTYLLSPTRYFDVAWKKYLSRFAFWLTFFKNFLKYINTKNKNADSLHKLEIFSTSLHNVNFAIRNIEFYGSNSLKLIKTNSLFSSWKNFRKKVFTDNFSWYVVCSHIYNHSVPYNMNFQKKDSCDRSRFLCNTINLHVMAANELSFIR